ncbi:MAG TPA: hypothetical protein VLF20_00290 [Patescibacteria group bacterium]|nr:hypothetical protein [Patescibacteria group bacterium]
MKKWIIRLLVIVVVAGISIFGIFFYRSITTPQKIHIHAGFIVFDNNKELDFSGNKYMNIKPCSEAEEDHEDEENEQLEKAHLHDNVGDIVHVERSDGKWKDLFTNINYSVDYTKVTAYINGQKVANFQNKLITAYDSAVIFIGKVDESKLKEAVKIDYMKEKEKKSNDCGSE